jgi:hypothetical protein
LTTLPQTSILRRKVASGAEEGFFAPGTPLYTEEGGDILKGPRKVEGAKRLLADSGYAGEPVTSRC